MSAAVDEDGVAHILTGAGLVRPRTELQQLAVYAAALEKWRDIHASRIAPGEEPFHVGRGGLRPPAAA